MSGGLLLLHEPPERQLMLVLQRRNRPPGIGSRIDRLLPCDLQLSSLGPGCKHRLLGGVLLGNGLREPGLHLV